MSKFNSDLNEFLRFLLAGGWALACYLFINPNEFKNFGGSVDLIILALIIGSIIYVIHRALFYPYLYRLICSILIYYKQKEWTKGDGKPFYFASRQEITENFKRWSERQKKGSFSSKHIVQWGSQVHFLYCSAFASLFTIAISLVLNNYNCRRLVFVGTLCFILFVAAIFDNLRLIQHDSMAEKMEKEFKHIENGDQY